MGDVSGCQPSINNLAAYLQGVSVEPSSTITSQYFVTASLPSSASLRRVWQFTTQGTISGTSTLTLDYTQAHLNCSLYNITFEGALNGTLIIHNQTFSANKYMSYALSPTNPYVLVLTINIPKKILQCYGVGTTQDYFFNIFVNDGTYSYCSCQSQITYQGQTYNNDNSAFLCLPTQDGLVYSIIPSGATCGFRLTGPLTNIFTSCTTYTCTADSGCSCP